jgi:hypothetical protein
MTTAGSNGAAPSSTDGDRSSDLLELADALMERARTLAAQSDQLIAALDDTARRLVESGRGVEGSPLPAPVRLVQRPAGPANDSADDSANGSPKGSTQDTVSEGARLLVTQMSLAGHGRAEIIKSLREELGIEDPETLLERAGL